MHDNCAEHLALFMSLDTIMRDTFKDLLRVLDHVLDDYQMSFYNLGAVSCELSRSVFNSVSNGELLAAVGLMRWQILLSQKAFLFYHNQESYERWKAGKNPKEVYMRSFLKKFEAEGKQQKYDSDDKNYEWLSKMYHLRYEDLDDLVVISPPKSLDEVLELDIRKFLSYNLKYFARVARTILMLHMSIVDKPSDRMKQIYSEFERITDRIVQLVDQLSKQESSLLQSRSAPNGN